MRIPRYIKQRPTPLPPESTSWDYLYKNRALRLAKLLSMNAPEPIVENECHALLKAITRSHSTSWALFRWARYAFHSWCHLRWFVVKWEFCRHVRRWDHDRCERYFFGEDEEQGGPKA